MKVQRGEAKNYTRGERRWRKRCFARWQRRLGKMHNQPKWWTFKP